MRLFFILLLLSVSSCASLAQPEGATIEVVNGKKYYVHIVQQGNTLYGIHRLYEIPVEDIVESNPGVEDGLSVGQKILIPIPGRDGLTQNLIIHTVEPKETLYGISKKYQVSEQELREANPELENGLKIGQELKIPVNTVSSPAENEVANPFVTADDGTEYQVSFKDTLITHTVVSGETLYSISKRFMVPEKEIKDVNEMRSSRIRPGDVIYIPIKKEKITKVEVREIEPLEKGSFLDSLFSFKRKNKYNIALLMPLYYDSSSMEVITDISTAYYMGAQLALDSLEKLGLKADVRIYDTKNDSNVIRKLLNAPEMKDLDLLFGPFFGGNAPMIAEWSKSNGVRMVCPFATNYKIVEGNPLVYEAVTSEVTLAKHLANHLMKDTSKNKQMILVKPSKKKDMVATEAFRQEYFGQDSVLFRKKVIETTIADLGTFLKQDIRNEVIFLSDDKGAVNNLINALNKASLTWKKENIVVYGTKDWMSFDNVPTKYKDKYQLHFMSPYDLDYSRKDFIPIQRKFREEFGTDMGKMSVQGFDVTMYFTQYFLLEQDVPNMLMNDFKLVQLGPKNGYENSKAYLMKFENYELHRVGEMHRVSPKLID